MEDPNSNAKSTESTGERKDQTGDVANRLVAIGKDCAAHLKEPFRSADHGDLLYGKDGLPSDR